METTSQDGTNKEYQIFIKANIKTIDGKINIYHLTNEEYISLNTAIEKEKTRWRWIRYNDSKNATEVNEWLFLNNIASISYMEELYEDSRLVKTLPVRVNKTGEK